MRALFRTKRILNKLNLRTNTKFITAKHNIFFYRKHSSIPQQFPKGFTNRNYSDESDIDNDIEEEIINTIVNEEQPVFTRNVLYSESDPLIKKINNSVSVPELMEILSRNKHELNYRHVTQSVVVIWDLLKIFYHVNGIPETFKESEENNFVKQLSESSEFPDLLQFIESHIEEFDVDSLSYVLLYLSKLGLSCTDSLFQLLVIHTKKKLGSNFSLQATSRFVLALGDDVSLRSYFILQDLIPRIFLEIESCKSAEDVLFLTISIGNSKTFVTNEIIRRYKVKVANLLDEGIITDKDYKTLIRIVQFLNFPEWRFTNVLLIRRCLLLLQNSLNYLNPSEISHLTDVFAKIQEPIQFLEQLQRTANKLLHQMEEESNPNVHFRLKFLHSIVNFSNSSNRVRYEAWMKKYMNENLVWDSLKSLRKLLTIVKTSDLYLCQNFWAKMLKTAVTKNCDAQTLVNEYTRFDVDIHNFRYFPMENHINKLIEKDLTSGLNQFIPSVLANYSTFLLPYSKNDKVLYFLSSKLSSNWQQLSCMDCLRISKGMQVARDVTDNEALFKDDVKKLRTAVNKAVMNNLGKMSAFEASILLKSFVFRGETEHTIIKYLLFALEDERLNSVLLNNVTYCLIATNSYLPKVVEKLVDYVGENKDFMLGVNVAKVLFLCYVCNYWPKDAEKFFNAVIDAILRDQERLNGLSFLQSALAMSYFNVLPKSVIKQIFNVSFLEKLDRELASCYSKTVYAARVRNFMMQLNRTVCLCYPEANVPWFHHQYVDEMKVKESYKNNSEKTYFETSVEDHLKSLIGNETSVESNVWSPYGYKIDFVLNSKKQDQKLAIILLKSKAYTQIVEQLKGQYHLQRRHLEILGYKVAFLCNRKWAKLSDDQEKVCYLRNLVRPKKFEEAQHR